jgi:glutamine amidotransferase
MVGIIDCQIGNIGSLRSALSYLGAEVSVVADPDGLRHCSAAILPGVGAFDPAMEQVEASGFAPAIKDYVSTGRPVLGICLGMQLFTEGSDEGNLPGLGLIKCRVKNLRALGCAGKLPHVGFNAVRYEADDSDFLARASSNDFYFVHSFGLAGPLPNVSCAMVEYQGASFVAALHKGNLFGTQFHPEKSGDAGLTLLRKFL